MARACDCILGAKLKYNHCHSNVACAKWWTGFCRKTRFSHITAMSVENSDTNDEVECSEGVSMSSMTPKSFFNGTGFEELHTSAETGTTSALVSRGVDSIKFETI